MHSTKNLWAYNCHIPNGLDELVQEFDDNPSMVLFDDCLFCPIVVRRELSAYIVMLAGDRHYCPIPVQSGQCVQ